MSLISGHHFATYLQGLLFLYYYHLSWEVPRPRALLSLHSIARSHVRHPQEPLARRGVRLASSGQKCPVGLAIGRRVYGADHSLGLSLHADRGLTFRRSPIRTGGLPGWALAVGFSRHWGGSVLANVAANLRFRPFVCLIQLFITRYMQPGGLWQRLRRCPLRGNDGAFFIRKPFPTSNQLARL